MLYNIQNILTVFQFVMKKNINELKLKLTKILCFEITRVLLRFSNTFFTETLYVPTN